MNFKAKKLIEESRASNETFNHAIKTLKQNHTLSCTKFKKQINPKLWKLIRGYIVLKHYLGLNLTYAIVQVKISDFKC